MNDIEQIDTKREVRYCKNTRITLTIGIWSDGKFSLARVEYTFDGSVVGTFYTPSDASRFHLTMDAALQAGLTWGHGTNESRSWRDSLNKRLWLDLSHGCRVSLKSGVALSLNLVPLPQG